jgi:hypothetical protein
MDWRKGLTTNVAVYRRRRSSPVTESTGAIHRTVILSSGSRFIAVLLARAAPVVPPSRKAAEYEDGG